jgi:hypothetical protein
MSMMRQIASCFLGLIGAVIGGALGSYIFMWIVAQGFYGLMIPGALLGLGCSLLSQHRSHVRGLICAAAACVLGLYSEWRFEPFRADRSFGYLVSHAAELRPITQAMIVLGAFFAYWLGKDAGFVWLPGAMRQGTTAQKPEPSRRDKME